MPPDTEESGSLLVGRIFMVQTIMIASSGLLFVLAVYIDLGFFWFSFIAGMFGSSLALLRRIQTGDIELSQATFRSWGTTLMPFLYGGLMAGVAYFLFASQILSGNEGNGLFATNLFPDFDHFTPESGRLQVKDWLRLRPKGMEDAGKLIVWCFLAGFSERFVSGILSRLEQSAGEENKD